MISQAEKNAREELQAAMKKGGYEEAGVLPACPKCLRDGGDVVEYDEDEYKWICKDCGHRFGKED